MKSGAAAMVTSPEQQRALERFYHFEARLLDARQYQQWLALVTEDVLYRMPARVKTVINSRTLPGQSWSTRSFMASVLILAIGLFICEVKTLRKC